MFGVQVVYVMPSTSGRAATYPRRVDKLKFFYELKELRDRLREQRSQLSTKTVQASSSHLEITHSPCSSHLDGSFTS